VLQLMLTISRRRSMTQEKEIEDGRSLLVDSEPIAATIQEQEGISRNNARGQRFSEFFRPRRREPVAMKAELARGSSEVFA